MMKNSGRSSFGVSLSTASLSDAVVSPSESNETRARYFRHPKGGIRSILDDADGVLPLWKRLTGSGGYAERGDTISVPSRFFGTPTDK